MGIVKQDMLENAGDPLSQIEDIQARVLEDEDFYLSEWEEEFIEDIQSKLKNDGDLTPAQQEKLEEIWEKAQ